MEVEPCDDEEKIGALIKEPYYPLEEFKIKICSHEN